jgi:hypothetical protein
MLLMPAALLGWAGRANAQDARVKTVVADDIVREVLRSIDRIISTDVAGQIDDAIRTATGSTITRGELRAYIAAQNRDFRITQEDRETKSVRLGAAGALELRTVGGNVTVSAGSGSDATIEIVRVSRGRTEADARLGLDRVHAIIDQRGDRATVSVDYPNENRPPYSVSVSYNVKAPAGTRLTINTLGGNITVTDIKGDMTTNTQGGNTTITHAHAFTAKSLGGTMKITGVDSDGTVQAETLGGDVELQNVKAKRIQASTVGGNVSALDITCETADLGTMGGNVTFSGPLARSGRYELHTNGWNVRFSPSGSVGYELQASTFAGDIHTEGVMLQLTGNVSNRGPNRSLRATAGDGSALVILRTFSGTVTVEKK